MLSSFHLCCSLLPFVLCGFVVQAQELQPAVLQVTAAPGPVVVAAGQDAVLPCQVRPAQGWAQLEVTWFREHFSPFVHRYKQGQDQFGEQMPQFQGRTRLLRGGLPNGSVDLKLLRARLADRGSYTCFVRRDPHYDEAVVELRVTASGSAPLLVLEQYQAGGIRLGCHSSGWHPEPRLLWQDAHGQQLPALSEDIAQDSRGLFAVNSSIILTRGTKQNLSCSVQDALSQQGQASALYVADPFFQNAQPWMAALGVTLLAVVALLLLAVYLLKVRGRQQATIALQKAALREREAEIERQAEELVKVVLDPDTAHCDLVLSEDCRDVRREDRRQDLPDGPQRFNPWRCVLGREGFTSGRHCWEVEVVDAGGWTVGVCREDVKRKGEIEFKPEEGIWAVGLWAGQLQALSSPSRTPLPQLRVPRRLRVCLDCAEGRVAFFSVDEELPIFTFPLASFEGVKVHPWVWLGPGTWLKMWP
ncbi:butyrophilin subfamily 1 member A1-like isoform X2 [Pogoniulus pusillus]|uniref:butyrophilin subfamily 1 member A1-like isoform X2 n=1 Tax=Pogoniulus pusillus TaxID=488313 RepID=UPI0030B96397